MRETKQMRLIIKTGDCICIGDFQIEVTFDAEAGEPIHLEDTLIHTPRETSPAEHHNETVPGAQLLVCLAGFARRSDDLSRGKELRRRHSGTG